MPTTRLSTAGMMLVYATETTAGTRPTTGYKFVPEVKSMPDFNSAPNQIQTTTLKETESHTYTPGLKDNSGANTYGANLNNTILDFWEKLISEYEEAIAAGKNMWFCIMHPKLSKAVYYIGTPSPLGFGGAEVDSSLDTNLYITPESAPEWGEKPTLADSLSTMSEVPIISKSKASSND